MAIRSPITVARKITIPTIPSGPTSCNKIHISAGLYLAGQQEKLGHLGWLSRAKNFRGLRPNGPFSLLLQRIARFIRSHRTSTYEKPRWLAHSSNAGAV